MRDDAISRQDALDIYDDYNIAVENGEIEAYGRFRKQLAQLPPIQPKREKWQYHSYIPHNKYCPKCKKDSPYNKRWNFCPNCGADMREVTT